MGTWSGHKLLSFPYITDPVWFPDGKCARPRYQETMKPYINYEKICFSCFCRDVLSLKLFINAIPYLFFNKLHSSCQNKCHYLCASGNSLIQSSFYVCVCYVLWYNILKRMNALVWNGYEFLPLVIKAIPGITLSFLK